MNIKTKALVFDFDGVIADTVPIKTNSFMEWIPPEYTSFKEQFFSYHIRAYGISRKDQLMHFYQHIAKHPISKTALNEEVARFGKINRKNIFNSNLFPDTLITIKRAFQKNIPLYIASGTPHDELQELVEHHSLKEFFRNAYGTPMKKAEAMRKIATQLGVSTEQLTMIGDATADHDAAKEVGATFIYKPSQAKFSDEIKPLTFEKLSRINFSLDTPIK